jgi:hypothetical protein
MLSTQDKAHIIARAQVAIADLLSQANAQQLRGFLQSDKHVQSLLTLASTLQGRVQFAETDAEFNQLAACIPYECTNPLPTNMYWTGGPVAPSQVPTVIPILAPDTPYTGGTTNSITTAVSTARVITGLLRVDPSPTPVTGRVFGTITDTSAGVAVSVPTSGFYPAIADTDTLDLAYSSGVLSGDVLLKGGTLSKAGYIPALMETTGGLAAYVLSAKVDYTNINTNSIVLTIDSVSSPRTIQAALRIDTGAIPPTGSQAVALTVGTAGLSASVPLYAVADTNSIDLSLAPASGVQTISATLKTTFTGTTNQVNVTRTGTAPDPSNYSFGLPQSIDTGATVNFSQVNAGAFLRAGLSGSALTDNTYTAGFGPNFSAPSTPGILPVAASVANTTTKVVTFASAVWLYPGSIIKFASGTAQSFLVVGTSGSAGTSYSLDRAPGVVLASVGVTVVGGYTPRLLPGLFTVSSGVLTPTIVQAIPIGAVLTNLAGTGTATIVSASGTGYNVTVTGVAISGVALYYQAGTSVGQYGSVWPQTQNSLQRSLTYEGSFSPSAFIPTLDITADFRALVPTGVKLILGTQNTNAPDPSQLTVYSEAPSSTTILTQKAFQIAGYDVGGAQNYQGLTIFSSGQVLIGPSRGDTQTIMTVAPLLGGSSSTALHARFEGIGQAARVVSGVNDTSPVFYVAEAIDAKTSYVRMMDHTVALSGGTGDLTYNGITSNLLRVGIGGTIIGGADGATPSFTVGTNTKANSRLTITGLPDTSMFANAGTAALSSMTLLYLQDFGGTRKGSWFNNGNLVIGSASTYNTWLTLPTANTSTGHIYMPPLTTAASGLPQSVAGVFSASQNGNGTYASLYFSAAASLLHEVMVVNPAITEIPASASYLTTGAPYQIVAGTHTVIITGATGVATTYVQLPLASTVNSSNITVKYLSLGQATLVYVQPTSPNTIDGSGSAIAITANTAMIFRKAAGSATTSWIRLS